MDKILYKLDTFEGPLDLLLTLIQKNKVSIYDIPIVEITAQYLEAIDGIEEANLDNTSEFLVMASNLLYIKSKMLLPKNEEEEDEEDPRAALARALIEYKRAKEAAAFLSDQYGIYAGRIAKEPEVLDTRSDLPEHIELSLLEKALGRVLSRNSRLPDLARESELAIQRLLSAKIVPVSAKIFTVMRLLRKNGTMDFEDILMTAHSRSELIAIFSATLELLKVQRLTMDTLDGRVLLTLNLTHPREGVAV